MHARKNYPTTEVDLLIYLGLQDVVLRTLGEVQAAQGRLNQLVMDAAESRWPDLLSGRLTMEEAVRMAWENAIARFPNIGRLAQTLLGAERAMYRDSKQVLA